MSIITVVILLFAGLAIGTLIGYLVRQQIAQSKANSAELRAEKMIAEAKNKEQEFLLQAKEKAIKIIDDAKQEEQERHKEQKQIQQRLEQRETLFDQKLLNFEDNKTKLEQKVEEVKVIRQKIEDMKVEAGKKLEVLSQLSREDARAELLKRVEDESKADLFNRMSKLEKDNGEFFDNEAKKIVIDAMQRCACNHANENTGTIVNLPSDEMKGRIIGKDGRNIKTIEKLTGCEILIDDTPGMLVISGFSMIRRRVAQLALEKLIKDGRIQPAKIEEYIDMAKKELALDIKKVGDEAVYEMGITGLDPKLISIVGRLKYRTSYGQNVLNHCTEVGYLAGMMADELGMDAFAARKAGFFHDIGKSIDHETQGAHTELGYKILKKFGLDEDTAQVAMTHHDTNPPLLLTKIVMAADAISASRIGARRDTHEEYVARLEELEKVANEFPGIEKVYAIQAGREIRVFVRPEAIDDYGAYNLAKDIARKIEQELTYPGEIKVNVIRENRVIEYAR
ncbi:MAG: ribonuclease Y [Candidatus Magasanikbacteria bacterium RIFCSPHIGHO2_01_FULL_41_23]|uniref:Ribonuclease Y n=1 Tax=Candidatus Magasanikbacteria bacterium RIFCSPLOWO2_01_FULL_40_15 TaxID=1798686 RepID=A0A1F6N391_9BACT|nr:MAG: ribonuclease Y [Candidatus Magasanikbacteria bacterium RIFCSPHIGHO2_01_FULL_41_23]OGH66933.1 MAG: ribonuclease Y [Candidatus Magasanikbacteria bacterium RIFCSPHIGHO2_02_FULL_41_35]OGH74915.1 MAG: ribonuclease Y [Candidatus Magasanikbacteria bacterium RIFCSPHIGHO2_12_FULL_41_16]OGH78218.1 MAG: ribonuclease Y [Candidatus Magasanikbacteria bacterium RIFCSPLOWO2_01_FULL_40_15]